MSFVKLLSSKCEMQIISVDEFIGSFDEHFLFSKFKRDKEFLDSSPDLVKTLDVS